MEKTSGVKVALGLKLDGPAPIVFKDALGEITVGPLGFLSLLETRLGISGTNAAFSQRLIQYLACIEAVQHPGAFYYASYQADPFSVARALLRWRDELYLAGWDGSFGRDVPARLADLAAIEALAGLAGAHDGEHGEHGEKVAPNTGQRIQVLLALLQNTQPGIELLTLYDRLEDFPDLWQRLVRAVQAPIENRALDAPQAKQGSDLGKLQAYLLRGDTGKLKLEGDNSIVALRAGTAGDSGISIAAHASALAASGKEIALLAELRGALLDEAHAALNTPRMGFRALSSARPLFQVLPLSLDLLWEPLDAQKLLQFLAHPYGPLPSRARRKLASCVADCPGVLSDKWNRAVAEILEQTEPGEREALQQRIGSWLYQQRYSPESGAPCAVLAAQASRVNDWLFGRFERETDDNVRNYCQVALNQVREFVEALRRLGEAGHEALSRDQVYRLIDDVKGSGSSVADRKAQLASGILPVLHAEHSGSFCNGIANVIWWDCQASDRVARWPWSDAEREALRDAGVVLQAESAKLRWLGEAWQRPILAARDSCLLVLHDDTERHHPIFDRLSANIDGLPTHDFDSSAARALLQMQRDALSPRELPMKQRWWQLPPGTQIQPRDRESYSSLSAFIYSPYQWLLKYPARLRQGMIKPVNDGGKLRGSLAHRLVEMFFASPREIPAIDLAALPAWVDANLPGLLEREGATLLLPGRQAECAEFTARMREALPALIAHLQQANVTSIETERYEYAPFCGGEIGGYIDLLAKCASGDEIVIDMKWGGRKFQRDSMREGKYLQLATYAFLRRAAGDSRSDAKLSYFILRDAQMLSLAHKLFPDAENVAEAEGENWATLWRRFEKTWQWRNEQHSRGLFEVTVANTEPDEDSVPPEDGLVIEAANDRFNDFSVLTGWWYYEPGVDGE